VATARDLNDIEFVSRDVGMIGETDAGSSGWIDGAVKRRDGRQQRLSGRIRGELICRSRQDQ
jgi:hypothetical protein